MAEKKCLDGNVKTLEAASSSCPKAVPDREKDEQETDNNKETTRRKEDSTNSAVSFYKLFSFADSIDYLLMLVGTVSAVGNGISIPLMTVLFGTLIDSFGQSGNTKDVLPKVSKVSLDFVYLALGSATAACLRERQSARIRSLYLKTILRQDIGFFDMQTNTGEVIERMSGYTVLIQEAMGEKVGKFIQLVMTFIGAFVVAFVKGWLLTLVMLSSIPALIISGAVMSITIGKLSSRGQSAYSQAAVVAEQTIGSIRTVASFTGEKLAVEKYNKSLAEAYKSGVQEGLASGLGMGVVLLVVFCTYGLAIWVGAKLIIEKGYTGGDIINIIFAVLSGSMSLGQASPSITAFAAGQAAAFKMFEAINRKPQIDAYDDSGKILEDIHGDIELRDVYFSYTARPDEQIFSGFSLLIPSGTTAALVGQSGSGKSTVISLIERFYDPQSGEVLIDGVNLKEFQLKWIRQKIGLVSQEPVLFTCSIKENIAYGKDGATVEEIRAAAELANAAKFIDKLPQEMDTMVGEHGTQLSGGQKQRVAIARAILKDPKILLLDEATSALDAESERIVQEALDRIMISRTTLIVAHRLSTIRNADTIAVIHRGKVVEKGNIFSMGICPHSELIKDPEGAYSQLIKLQQIHQASEQLGVASDQDRPGLIVNSGRYSSQRFSSMRSISRGSSGNDISSRHSFSVSFGVPATISTLETTPAEANSLVASTPTPPPPPQVPQEVSLRRLALLNKPETPVLLLGTIAAAVSGMIFPVFGLLLSRIVKTFFEPPDVLRKDSKFWALVFVGLGMVSLLASPSSGYFFTVAGCKLIRRIRSICFEKVVYMEVSWFDEGEHSSGAIGARLSADAALVRGLVGDALGLLVQNVATAVAGLIIAFKANWQMALIVLVLLPLIGLSGYVQVKFMKGFSSDAKKMYEEASKIANDAVGGIRTVASFCAEEKVMELYQKKCEGPIKAGIRQGLISGIGFGLSLFLVFNVYACTFYAGARLVAAGKTSFTDVFQVLFALTMAATGVSQSGSLNTDINKAKNAAASVFAILDRKSKIDSSDDSGTVLESLKGDIEFRHVSFNYPTRPDVLIFQDLCLAIHSGKQMGLVSQEPVLFNDTIRSNIAYGKQGNATETEILSAAQLANAHTFISSLQQGYDTIVGERGIQLSGGQKQRVAIARAIVKAPKILFLDEATSALDAESERVVQHALDRVMVDRTTVVVAHRLSSINGADLIAVVKNGVIAEKGKHETLMAIKDGVYASLVALHTTTSS
ncbi:hypothetical protein TIFTF001_041139 [Ficus carica]|uniref:Uncharacterized protein n=1 Tax=Ficus carica TaxID=3494 RepID=A0AA87ZKN5_FICCA|nr:hypothetical protein TIFTF001_041139 [Ficus carica]